MFIYSIITMWGDKMQNYEKLKEYVEKSEIREFNERITVRFSKELAVNYDKGLYNDYLETNSKHIELLDSLNIKYKNDKLPTFYFYIVPDNNYAELLNIPDYFAKKSNCGGKPVESFDNDSYSRAYGISQNIALSKHGGISSIANQIHELAHLVTSEFNLKHAFVREGIAELIPLYILDIESEFDDHRDVLSSLTEDKIFTINELLNFDKTGLGGKPLVPDRSCSFEQDYASSYLVIRGIIDIIIEKFNVSKIEALQFFLDTSSNIDLSGKKFILKLSEILGVDNNELLNSKNIQLQVVKDLNMNNSYLAAKVGK